MINAPANPQNSSSVCQSRPLRASRDASRDSTAATRPSQIAARSFSKPGRRPPAPDRPRSSLRLPTSQVPDASDESVLSPLAFQVLRDLKGGGLPDINDRATRNDQSRFCSSPPPSLLSPLSLRSTGLDLLQPTSSAAPAEASVICWAVALVRKNPAVSSPFALARRLLRAHLASWRLNPNRGTLVARAAAPPGGGAYRQCRSSPPRLEHPRRNQKRWAVVARR